MCVGGGGGIAGGQAKACMDFVPPCPAASPWVTAVSPWVTAVGGTTASVPEVAASFSSR